MMHKKSIMKRCLRFYNKILTNDVIKLNISVTDRCNMRCRTCRIWKKNKINSSEMNLKDFENIFKKFNKTCWLSLTGGEPFLRKDLYEIVDISLKECKNLHTISIPTNGFLTFTI